MIDYSNKPEQYRDRVRWVADTLFDEVVTERMKQGADPDIKALANLLGQCVRVAQLKLDMMLGMGLDSIEDDEEKNDGRTDVQGVAGREEQVGGQQREEPEQGDSDGSDPSASGGV